MKKKYTLKKNGHTFNVTLKPNDISKKGVVPEMTQNGRISTISWATFTNENDAKRYVERWTDLLSTDIDLGVLDSEMQKFSKTFDRWEKWGDEYKIVKGSKRKIRRSDRQMGELKRLGLLERNETSMKNLIEDIQKVTSPNKRTIAEASNNVKALAKKRVRDLTGTYADALADAEMWLEENDGNVDDAVDRWREEYGVDRLVDDIAYFIEQDLKKL